MADMSQEVRPEGQAKGHGAIGDELIEEETPERKSRLRTPLLLAAPVVALIAALFFYLNGGRYASTDNAYLQSGMVQITSNVSGHVVTVAVHENQFVHAGDVLFTLDPTPFKTAVAEAEADLANARTQVGSLQANYQAAQAQTQAAKAQLDYAVREAARQKELLAEGISSQNQYDQAVLAVRTARENIRNASGQAKSVAASLSGNVGAPAAAQPAVQRAEAALEHARLELGYTIIRAPQDGIVTKVSQLQVGDYVTASKPVFTLVGRHIWVEANFKENQLHYMRIGQPAEVKIDAFPDQKLRAHVASFSPGTGNAFSLLPPENATGNWVKVVQRLPVELEIENLPAGIPAHAGLSTEVTVDTGHQRHLFGPDTPPIAPKARPAR
ncbi:MAG TPA: HlyD family secretion protein [Allosphingosinicella sp.]|nr:HlyD family secretion protein [Allosphingosinicella sp.]